MGLTPGRRGRAVVRAVALTTAVTVVAALGSGVAIGAPSTPTGAGDFATSFETGEPQPAASTAETLATGPKQHNVSGTVQAPGSLLGTVTAVTASAQNAPNEVASNLADANSATKWLAFASTGWVAYQLSAPAKAVRYTLTAADDAPERDPKDVTLQGSSDGTTWVDLDTRTGIDFANRFATRTFDITSPGSYAHYRLNVDANHSGGLIQLAGWDLLDGSTEPGADRSISRVLYAG